MEPMNVSKEISSPFESFKTKFLCFKEHDKLEALSSLKTHTIQDFDFDEVKEIFLIILNSIQSFNFWSTKFRMAVANSFPLFWQAQNHLDKLAPMMFTEINTKITNLAKSDVRTLSELFNWANSLIAYAPEKYLLKEGKPNGEFGLIIKNQVSILHNLGGKLQFPWKLKYSMRLWQRVLQKHFAFYLIALKATKPSEQVILPLSLFLQAWNKCDQKQKDLFKQDLLDLYLSVALPSSGKLLQNTAAFDIFVPLLQTIDAQQLQAVLKVQTTRVKENLENVLPAIAHFYRTVRLSADAQAKEAFALAAPSISNSKQPLRLSAVAALSAVSSRISDPKILIAWFKDFFPTLKGKGPSERADMISVIREIYTSCQTDELRQKIAESPFLDDFAKFLTNEVNESVLIVSYHALALWVSHLTSWSTSIVNLFTQVLKKNKERVLNFTLLSFVLSLDRARPDSKVIPQIVKFSSSLVGILKNAKLNVENINALHTLLLLSKVDKNTAQEFNKLKYWKPEGPIFKVSFLSKLAPEEAEQWIHLFSTVSQQSFDDFGALEQGVRDMFYSGLVYFLTQPNRVLQNNALKAIANNKNAAVPKGVLHSLYTHLEMDSPKSLFLQQPRFFGNGLLSVLSDLFELVDFPLAFALAHHPSIGPASGFTYWRFLRKKAKLASLDVVAKELSACIISEKFLFHSNPELQECARNTVHTVKNFPAVLEAMVQHLVEVFEERERVLEQDVSEEEIQIFQTQPPHVFQEKKRDRLVDEFLLSKNPKKPQDSKYSGMSAKEDEEWERNLRKELEEKHRKEFAREIDEIHRKVLEEEAQIRLRIATSMQPVTAGLTFFDTLSQLAPDALHDLLCISVQALVQLSSKTGVLQAAARDALVSLRRMSIAVAPVVRGLHLDLAGALTLVLDAHFEPRGAAAEEFFTQLLKQVQERLGSEQAVLPGGTFAYLFLVLDFILTKAPNFPLPLKELALSLTAAHAGGSQRGLPRAAMANALVHTLGSASSDFQRKSRAALLSLTPYMHLELQPAQSKNNSNANIDNESSDDDEEQEESEEVDPNNNNNTSTDTKKKQLNNSSRLRLARAQDALLRGLLDGLISPAPHVRLGCLEALDALSPSLVLRPTPLLTTRLWLACYDTAHKQNETLALAFWKRYNHPLKANQFWPPLAAVFDVRDDSVHRIVGAAIVGALKTFPGKQKATLSALRVLYEDNLLAGPADPEAEKKENVRHACAVCISSFRTLAEQAHVETIFHMLLTIFLFDPNDDIRQSFTQAGIDIINDLPASKIEDLLKNFEDVCGTPSKSEEEDRVRESVVIFMGSVARHLDSSNPKLEFIWEKLFQTLKTPSEPVQRSVANSFVPLISKFQNRAEQLIAQLLEQIKKGKDYGERRGAAFGLAGVVKGLGSTALKKYDITAQLEKMAEDKKHLAGREGAMMAYECLSMFLGRVFEPQISGILDTLLNNYNDSNDPVRNATSKAAKSIMSQLSAHGIKLVLPVILKALEDRSWRKKKGSIELLGAMAFCSPKQLSNCLPTIVPKLSKVINDTHSEVQESAEESLKTIGSVIQNPEIKLHVPVILKAIIENEESTTKEALEALIHINFIHVIDAPSLSLIVPILHKGLKNRSTESKKRAAQILGSMSSLTDHKDLIPYLELLVPFLRDAMCDPIPEVRAISSRALGNLIKGLGAEHFGELIPWCLEKMKSSASSVDRAGAAQGLSEVLAALEPSALGRLLPEILQLTSSPQPHIRDGYLGIFIFLPLAMREGLQSYLAQVLPHILEGLADETEQVRDTALRAGQAIIDQYTTSHLDLLLPPVQDNLFSENWRIRQSAIQLMGDLLYKIVGRHEGNADLIEKALTATFGPKRKNKILATIYVLRSDVSSVVRQRALFVWKSNVLNTAKALKEILPTLLDLIMECLASPNHDQRKISGKALGEVVSKMGDKVLPEVVPILENALKSPEVDKRQGVCVGLVEVLKITSKVQIGTYLSSLTATIRKALCDTAEPVRDAAIQAFSILHKSIGTPALNEILPQLLQEIEKEDENAMNGLKVLLSVQSEKILPLLVPKLLSPPLTPFNLRALASMAEVVGEALHPQLPTLLPALLEAIHNSKPDDKFWVRKSAAKVVISLDEEGARLMFEEFKEIAAEATPSSTVEILLLIKFYCENAPLENFKDEISNLLSIVFPFMGASDKDVLETTLETLTVIVKNIDKADTTFVPNVHEMLFEMVKKLKAASNDNNNNNNNKDQNSKDNVFIPGFSLPKGPQCVITLAINGLVGGSTEVRERAAQILSEVLIRTPGTVLTPFVITITGSLIRTMSDKFPANVKVAILRTLGTVIEYGGAVVKTVLTQLQTTFVRALKDLSKSVRNAAAVALGHLMVVSPRVDAVAIELLGKISGGSGFDRNGQEANLVALREVLSRAGEKIGAETLTKIGSTLSTLLGHEEAAIRRTASEALGFFSKFATETQLHTLIENQFLARHSSWEQKQSACIGLRFLLLSQAALFAKFGPTILHVVQAYVADEQPAVRAAATEALEGLLLIPEVANDPELLSKVCALLTQTLADDSHDVKIIGLKTLRRFAKVVQKQLNIFVPVLMQRVKERDNFAVKLSAERALMHILQIHSNPKILETYAATLEPSQAKVLTDYAKRILSKLPPDSEDEEEEEPEDPTLD